MCHTQFRQGIRPKQRRGRPQCPPNHLVARLDGKSQQEGIREDKGDCNSKDITRKGNRRGYAEQMDIREEEKKWGGVCFPTFLRGLYAVLCSSLTVDNKMTFSSVERNIYCFVTSRFATVESDSHWSCNKSRRFVENRINNANICAYLCANLVAALASLEVNNFAHDCKF